MTLTKENSNETICAYLMGRDGQRMRFYCPKTQMIFDASLCDCGAMVAHSNYIHIESIDNALHRALSAYFKVLDFNEFVGYDDDNGTETCEECA